MTDTTTLTAGPGTVAEWGARADVAQASLDHWYGTAPPQRWHNSHPAGDDSVFNYWWLAHVVDVRLDAWHRTGDPAWLAEADAVSENIRQRNGGELFNDYFDDMLWWALALLRLHRAGGEARHLEQSVALWEHVVEHGWNTTHGESLAWRKQSLHYKNTPANGPLIILSARLHQLTGDPRHLPYAQQALAWLEEHLVEPDGFVHDGVNREQDGRVDVDWRYTYNQGLYVGALLAVEQVTGDASLLERAGRTALTSLTALGDGEVFGDEGDGGDVGLFKGIAYRYYGLLLDRLAAVDGAEDVRERLAGFVRTSTDALWASSVVDGHLLPGTDWRRPAGGPMPYSALLSAIKATELRARLEEGRPADTRLA
ncbi:glycoside hydrolase [Desertihabitans brevis]|uniref:Glycoside hydrolase n=1 Tax=Desertihabitans brevis TaxID=2268447 RepID=A0A367YZ31_9ACTN|nr:glycoside hydrolase family 76 protein [Desertihabitans brevis]RCK70211.1 glycoside hydrolase [Desertihabitans brevis]